MVENGDVSNNSEKINAADDGIKLVTEDLFHDILEKQFGECTIRKFGVTPSSSAGENYVCSMYRVTIEIEKQGMDSTNIKFSIPSFLTAYTEKFSCITCVSYFSFRWN